MHLVKIYTVAILNTFVYINSFAIFWQCFWRKFTQWNTNQPSISITLPRWIMQWFCCGSFCTTCRLCSWYNFKRPLLTTSTYHAMETFFFLKKLHGDLVCDFSFLVSVVVLIFYNEDYHVRFFLSWTFQTSISKYIFVTTEYCLTPC